MPLGWPLRGWPLPVATGGTIFETAAGDPVHAFVRDHSFNGHGVWPATASAEKMSGVAIART